MGAPLEVFAFFRFDLVRWELLPPLLPTWLGMYVVVAFSSSLDVAAIQMDMGRQARHAAAVPSPTVRCLPPAPEPKQLDFNHELVTVGLSNALSGLTGGFTGSYIFSQTIFTFRTGTNSRACGLVVIAAELLLFLMPFSIVSCAPHALLPRTPPPHARQPAVAPCRCCRPHAARRYIPKLFFGAVLTFIALDLMWDWLWRSRAKVHPAEYLIIWFTFLLVNLVGLELGMACGVLASMAQFILDYARVPVVQRVSLRSNVMRSPVISTHLADLQPSIITLRCRGYIFFGSTLQVPSLVPSHLHPSHRPRPPLSALRFSTQIMSDVLGSVVLPSPPSPAEANGAATTAPAGASPPAGAPPPRATGALGHSRAVACGATPARGGGGGGPARKHSREGSLHGGAAYATPYAPELPEAVPTRFVVFDFTMVNGLDATAARSCFLNLCRTLAPSGISLVFGGVAEGGTIHRLLIGHDILGEGAGETAASRFDTIDEALEHCEQELLLRSSTAQRLEQANRLLAEDDGASNQSGGGAGGSGGVGIPRSRSSAQRLAQVRGSLVESSP